MNYLFDASSLINLANGGVLRTVLQIPGSSYFIEGLVREESESIKTQLDVAIVEGLLSPLDASVISATTYLELLDRYGLGEGETECLAAAKATDYTIVSDDLRARNVAVGLLGTNRVIGTIGLLRIAVAEKLLARDQAFVSYQVMKSFGAFLPTLTIDNLFPNMT